MTNGRRGCHVHLRARWLAACWLVVTTAGVASASVTAPEDVAASTVARGSADATHTVADEQASRILVGWADAASRPIIDGISGGTGVAVELRAVRPGQPHHGSGVLSMTAWRTVWNSADSWVTYDVRTGGSRHCPGEIDYAFDPATFGWRISDNVRACVTADPWHFEGSGELVEGRRHHYVDRIHIDVTWQPHGSTRIQTTLAPLVSLFVAGVPYPDSLSRWRKATAAGSVSIAGVPGRLVFREAPADVHVGWRAT